jgi:hypothetical protein
MIHPDVKKFWEDAGYRVDATHFGDIIANWWAERNGQPSILIATERPEVKYVIADGWYTEKQTLKIIKLKAFI